MRALPLSIGTIHFVGIGGIGMSGIAEVLRNLGYSVRGSDIADSANVKRLRALGIPVEIGHRGENLADASVVVISSAVKKDNPEVVAARQALIPVVRRAEMLARTDAPEVVGRDRRHPRQDHDHQHGRHPAGRRRTRPDRHQRRHHQRLRHQYPARLRRLDGGRGGRERRHLHQAAGPDHRRHQHRPGAPRPLRHLRRRQGGVRELRPEHPVLRLRRTLHRPSRSPGDDPARLRPPHRDLRLQPAGRCPRHRRGDRHRRRPLQRGAQRPRLRASRA